MLVVTCRRRSSEALSMMDVHGKARDWVWTCCSRSPMDVLVQDLCGHPMRRAVTWCKGHPASVDGRGGRVMTWAWMVLPMVKQCYLVSFHDRPCFEGLCVLVPSYMGTWQEGKEMPTGGAGICRDPWGSAGLCGKRQVLGSSWRCSLNRRIQDPLGLPALMVTFRISLVVLGYLLPFFIHALSCDG